MDAVDFVVADCVRVRVLDASEEDVAAVRGQLGPIDAPASGVADLAIRFVDVLLRPSGMGLLGLGDVLFSKSAFLVAGRRRNGRYAQIPFERIGGDCEVTCERGLGEVPLLIALVNATALSKGVLPLHASALNIEGIGVLVAGWSKGGKTEVLLSFMRRGADYVGDEWVYLTPDCMRGIPEPMRVWSWQLQQLPEYRAVLSRRERSKLRGLGLLAAGAAATSKHLPSQATRTGARATALLERQLNVRIPPHRLFGKEHCTMRGSPDKVILVGSHSAPEATVKPLEASVVAERMRFSLLEEREPLNAVYRQFRFCFPDLSSPLLEEASQIERDLLHAALGHREAHLLLHPYPPAIPSLFVAASRALS